MCMMCGCERSEKGNFSYVQMKDVYNSIFQSDNREKLFAYEYGYYVSFSSYHLYK